MLIKPEVPSWRRMVDEDAARRDRAVEAFARAKRARQRLENIIRVLMAVSLIATATALIAVLWR